MNEILKIQHGLTKSDSKSSISKPSQSSLELSSPEPSSPKFKEPYVSEMVTTTVNFNDSNTSFVTTRPKRRGSKSSSPSSRISNRLSGERRTSYESDRSSVKSASSLAESTLPISYKWFNEDGYKKERVKLNVSYKLSKFEFFKFNLCRYRYVCNRIVNIEVSSIADTFSVSVNVSPILFQKYRQRYCRIRFGQKKPILFTDTFFNQHNLLLIFYIHFNDFLMIMLL